MVLVLSIEISRNILLKTRSEFAPKFALLYIKKYNKRVTELNINITDRQTYIYTQRHHSAFMPAKHCNCLFVYWISLSYAILKWNFPLRQIFFFWECSWQSCPYIRTVRIQFYNFSYFHSLTRVRLQVTVTYCTYNCTYIGWLMTVHLLDCDAKDYLPWENIFSPIKSHAQKKEKSNKKITDMIILYQK